MRPDEATFLIGVYFWLIALLALCFDVSDATKVTVATFLTVIGLAVVMAGWSYGTIDRSDC